MILLNGEKVKIVWEFNEYDIDQLFGFVNDCVLFQITINKAYDNTEFYYLNGLDNYTAEEAIFKSLRAAKRGAEKSLVKFFESLNLDCEYKH